MASSLVDFCQNYYRSIFRHGQEPGFDPVAIGVGQGLTQGVTAGAIIGVLLVAILTWYRVKKRLPDANRVA